MKGSRQLISPPGAGLSLSVSPRLVVLALGGMIATGPVTLTPISLEQDRFVYRAHDTRLVHAQRPATLTD